MLSGIGGFKSFLMRDWSVSQSIFNETGNCLNVGSTCVTGLVRELKPINI